MNKWQIRKSDESDGTFRARYGGLDSATVMLLQIWEHPFTWFEASCLKSSVWILTLQSIHWIKMSEIKSFFTCLPLLYYFWGQCASLPLQTRYWETPSCSWAPFVNCMTWSANVALFGVLCFIETSHLERDSILTGSPRKQQPGSHSRWFRKGQGRSHGPLPCRLVHR